MTRAEPYEPAGPTENEILSQLTAMGTDADPIATTLRTDKKVLARVTDGIYRQPGSALRELISNAHDADATRVTIRTDRPRFQRVVVEDDGIGMSPETLVHLLYHIGGSAKRTVLGENLGMTSPGDISRSPGGRKLIGKIGIGLFSVAQLTHSFQIITKTAGSDFRSVATVVLRQYAEDFSSEEGDGEFEAGKVLVWKEPAADSEAHGTSIVLTAMRPQTRETLKSHGLWQSVFPNEQSDDKSEVMPPTFHIGVVQANNEEHLRKSTSTAGYNNLPWSPGEAPSAAFDSLASAVWNAQYAGDPNPRIDKLCDYYLQMVWDLSLQAPLDYIAKHPFDTRGSDRIQVFDISGSSVAEINLAPEQTVRNRFELGDAAPSVTDFRVIVDDLELKRPIDIRDRPPTSGVLSNPLLFVAKYREDFVGADAAFTGGPFEFQAYIRWSPKIVPVEHSGAVIRVHNASGSTFDETFLRFPVAEQRRLAQISCEIFVTRGFDGALNIDRESFNFAHPHVVALTRWLHAALRQVIATQKRLGAAARADRQKRQASNQRTRLAEIVDRVWEATNDVDSSMPPDIRFVDERMERGASDLTVSAYLLDRERVLGSLPAGPGLRQRRESLEEEMSSAAKVLSAYGVLGLLSEDEREELLAALREIFRGSR